MNNYRNSNFDAFKQVVNLTVSDIHREPLAKAYKIVKSRNLRFFVESIDNERISEKNSSFRDPGRINVKVENGLIVSSSIG